MAITNTEKVQKFKEWFMNSVYNTSEGAYKYTDEKDHFVVRFVDDNVTMRFVPNGKSFKKRGF